MRYLAAEDILVLHARVVDATGGSHGVRDAGLVAPMAHRPQAAFGGRDVHVSLFGKAAALMESIVNYHAFTDGNKRTALICTARFLHLNGYKLSASNDEAVAIVLAVAEKRMDEAALATWIETSAEASEA